MKGVKIPMPLGFEPPEEAFEEEGSIASVKYKVKDDKLEIYEFEGHQVEPQQKKKLGEIFREAANLPMSEEEKLMIGGQENGDNI